MKAELVRFLFPFSVLLLCGAGEQALPCVWSVGFPLLMTAALALGSVRAGSEAVLLAVLAGTLEDALSALPLATTASFLILVTLCARVVPAVRLLTALAYPIYQFWLVVWTTLPAGALWGRLLVSVPLAVATVCLLHPILLSCERRLIADAR